MKFLLFVFCIVVLPLAFILACSWHGGRMGERDRARFIARTGKTPERALWESMRDSSK
jgi:hypothetical protein